MEKCIKDDFYIEVKISSNRILVVNLKDELSIDLNNLNKELSKQPGKFAWWSVAEKLAEIKLSKAGDKIDSVKSELSQEYGSINLGDRRLKRAVVEYVRVHNQHILLQQVRKAFDHRTGTMIALADGQEQECILDSYNSTLSNLWALGA